MDYLMVGLGSALGGMARHWIALTSLNRFGPDFPWGTFIVNVVGSLAIGFFASLAVQGKGPMVHLPLQRFLLIGLFGGFTTFSSFSLQTLQLFEKGQTNAALMNVIGSILSCLFAAFIGMRAGRLLVG